MYPLSSPYLAHSFPLPSTYLLPFLYHLPLPPPKSRCHLSPCAFQRKKFDSSTVHLIFIDAAGHKMFAPPPPLTPLYHSQNLTRHDRSEHKWSPIESRRSSLTSESDNLPQFRLIEMSVKAHSIAWRLPYESKCNSISESFHHKLCQSFASVAAPAPPPPPPRAIANFSGE